MKDFSDEKILKNISDSVSKLTPDKAQEIWKKPVLLADEDPWYLDSESTAKTKSKKRNSMLRVIAACLALCIFAGLMYGNMPSAAVYLDVNPSIVLDVNYRDRITGVRACNKDAEIVLGEMDLKGTDLDVGIYAILGSMVRHGYLTEAKDTVLVSVQCSNESRADKLQENVSGQVSESLRSLINAGEVLSQQVDEEDEDEDDCSCTPGKTSFIEDLLKKYPQLKKYELQNLTMDEIVELLEKEDLDFSDYLDDDEDDDDDDDVDEDDDDDDENDDDDDDDKDDDGKEDD